ncbi:MAG: hypothetical protein NE328_08360 [Lentisphaeraceae bacterium]|nr:hypothetical protein [Lentisphaeraceae bacterium]
MSYTIVSKNYSKSFSHSYLIILENVLDVSKEEALQISRNYQNGFLLRGLEAEKAEELCNQLNTKGLLFDLIEDSKIPVIRAISLQSAKVSETLDLLDESENSFSINYEEIKALSLLRLDGFEAKDSAYILSIVLANGRVYQIDILKYFYPHSGQKLTDMLKHFVNLLSSKVESGAILDKGFIKVQEKGLDGLNLFLKEDELPTYLQWLSIFDQISQEFLVPTPVNISEEEKGFIDEEGSAPKSEPTKSLREDIKSDELEQVFPFESIDDTKLSRRIKGVYKALGENKSSEEVLDSMISKGVLTDQAQTIINILTKLRDLREKKSLTFGSSVEVLESTGIPEMYFKAFLSTFGFTSKAVIGQKSKKELTNDTLAKPRKYSFICLITLILSLFFLGPLASSTLNIVIVIVNLIVVCGSSFLGLWFSILSIKAAKKETTGKILGSIILLLIHLGCSSIWVDGLVNMQYYREATKVKYISRLCIQYQNKNQSLPKDLTLLSDFHPNVHKLLSSSVDDNPNDIDYIMNQYNGNNESLFLVTKVPVRYWFIKYQVGIKFNGKVIRVLLD